jgi:hypothetical protein
MFRLFFLKLKSGALLYHLRRKQLYITSRSERHHHKYNTHNNAPNKTLHHLNLEEKPEAATMNCAAVTNVVPRQQTRPAPSQSDNSSSSTTGPSTSSRTKKVADPPVPTKRRHRTPVMAPMQATDPGHSAWGPRLIHCLTLHCQGLRYLKPVWKQRTRPAVTEVTTAPSLPTQDL